MNTETLLSQSMYLGSSEAMADDDRFLLQIIDDQANRPIGEKEDGDFERSRSNVINLPQFKKLEHRPTEFFAAVQEWEGSVTEVGEDCFYADLVDVTSGGSEVTEKAEISFEDIDPNDRRRVREGAVFRWLIGHSRTRSGQFSRRWIIYFRRALPASKDDNWADSIQVPEHLRAPTPVG